MTAPRGEQVHAALLVAADRAALYGTISRWLVHDLRGPAQAVSLVTDLLEHGDRLEEAAVRSSLEEASARLRDLLELRDQVLRRPDPGAAPRPIALRDSLALAARLLRLHRSATSLRMDQALDASLPAVRGVDEDVQHALLSLLVNAYEALARQGGGGTVQVTAQSDAQAVRLIVTDDGPGIDRAVRERLFELFVTTKTGRPLAGLGLPVARMLLERSGGRLSYEAVSPGARFVVELPVWV
jgi:signal transduction histidine kinase